MFCSASIICSRTVFVFEGSCDFSLLEVRKLITIERVFEKKKLNILMRTELRTETIKSRLNDQILIMII